MSNMDSAKAIAGSPSTIWEALSNLQERVRVLHEVSSRVLSTIQPNPAEAILEDGASGMLGIIGSITGDVNRSLEIIEEAYRRLGS